MITIIPNGPASLQCTGDGENCFAIVHFRVLPQAWLVLVIAMLPFCKHRLHFGMLACHVLCVFEVGLVVAIVLARMQARSPFMVSMDLEAAASDLGPLIVRQNNWVAAVAAAITEVFFAVFKCQWHGLQIVAGPTEGSRPAVPERVSSEHWLGPQCAREDLCPRKGHGVCWLCAGAVDCGSKNWPLKRASDAAGCVADSWTMAHAAGVFRSASLRKSEAAWTGLGFDTIGRNAEGLKLMQCPISVFLHGSPPQQEELTSSQQREPGESRADDLERTLLQLQRRCEELEQKKRLHGPSM